MVNVIFDPFNATWFNKSAKFQTFEWLYIKMFALVIHSFKNNAHLRSVKCSCNFLAQESNASIDFCTCDNRGHGIGHRSSTSVDMDLFFEVKALYKPRRLMFSHICQFVILFFGFEMDYGNKGAKCVLTLVRGTSFSLPFHVLSIKMWSPSHLRIIICCRVSRFFSSHAIRARMWIA